MKVDELRAKLFQLEKHDIIRLAVEFYKLVPKTKKEDYNLDTLINTPQEVKTAKPVAKDAFRSLDDIEDEVNEFIINAKEQNYLFPNKVISKKERATWRFKVKAWYKELIHPKNHNNNLSKKADICSNLYGLMCESCDYQYFSSDDPFGSVGVEKSVFFQSTLELIEKTDGKTGVLNRGFDLIFKNNTNPYSLDSELLSHFFDMLDTIQLKEALSKAETLLEKTKPPVVTNPKRGYSEDFTQKYQRERKINNLAKFGFLLYARLHDYDSAILFYNKYAKENDSEVKLYILIDLLLKEEQKDYIISILEKAQESGEKLRRSLLDLLTRLQKGQELPRYIG